MTRKQAMQEAIDAAWANPEGEDLRRLLFPDGKPDPETFIYRVSKYVQQKTGDPL